VNTSTHPGSDPGNEVDMSRTGGTRGTCPAGTGATLRFVAQFIEMERTVSTGALLLDMRRRLTGVCVSGFRV
jgi:hypothetical protein